MGFETKPNLVDGKFEQCSSDILTLCGCTQVTGILDIHPTGSIDSCSGYKISGQTILKTSKQTVDSIYIGSTAGSNGTGAYNIGLGCNALCSVAAGNNNIAMGFTTMQKTTTGCYNTAIGSLALFNNLGGNWNVGMGLCALNANTSGCYNVALGNCSLPSNTTGNNNIGLGLLSGAQSSLGSGNVYIGSYSGSGHTGSNRLFIGNSKSCTLIYGDFTGNTVTLPTLKLCTTPATGTASDLVLVWNSTDKQVKCITSSSLVAGVSTMCTMTITGNGTATGFTLNHAMNVSYPMVQIVKDTAPYSTVYTDTSRPNANCVCVMFDVAPANLQAYRVLIIK